MSNETVMTEAWLGEIRTHLPALREALMALDNSTLVLRQRPELVERDLGAPRAVEVAAFIRALDEFGDANGHLYEKAVAFGVALADVMPVDGADSSSP